MCYNMSSHSFPAYPAFSEPGLRSGSSFPSSITSMKFGKGTTVWIAIAAIAVLLAATIVIVTVFFWIDGNKLKNIDSELDNTLNFCPGQTCDSTTTVVKVGDCFMCLYIHTDVFQTTDLLSAQNVANPDCGNIIVTVEQIPDISVNSPGQPDWKGFYRTTVTGYLLFSIISAGDAFGGAIMLPVWEDMRTPGYPFALTLAPSGGSAVCAGVPSATQANVVPISAFIGCNSVTMYPPCILYVNGQSDPDWSTLETIVCRIESSSILGAFN